MGQFTPRSTFWGRIGGPVWSSCGRLVSESTIMAVVLAGCSGGVDPAPPTREDLVDPLAVEEEDYSSGDFFGAQEFDDQTPAEPVQIVLSEDGRFLAWTLESNKTLIRGSFDLNGHLISGDGVAISGSDVAWPNGEAVAHITFAGTVTPPTNVSDGRLLISVHMDFGDTFRIDSKFAINSGYWRGSDLPQLEGHWGPYPDSDGPSLVLSVSDNGLFTGSDDDGCRLRGQFSLISPRYGLWAVDYTQTECIHSGTYAGLALRDNGWYGTQVLTLVADDGNDFRRLELWKRD